MPSLKDFVEALQAGWFPALVALIGCSAFLAGSWYHFPYLSDAPTWLTTIAAIIAVFAFAILVAQTARAPSILIKWLRGRRAERERERKIMSLVHDAPDDERTILAYLVSSGRQAFAAKLDDRRLVPLLAKGMILRPPGPHDVLAWPHLVQKDVWDYLVLNSEQFHFENATEIPDIFHWRNREWL